MPITFNRVSRSYRLTVKSTDEDKILEVASLAEKLGLDVIIEEEVEGFKKPTAPRVWKPISVYGIWRDKILGYIGTSNDPDRRIKQHSDQLEFARWILDGIDNGDVHAHFNDPLPYNEGRALEKRLIRQFSPLYNKNEKRLVSLSDSGGDLMNALGNG